MLVIVDTCYFDTTNADRCEVVNTSAAVTCYVTLRLRGHSPVV
jgi:hypothetical protein